MKNPSERKLTIMFIPHSHHSVSNIHLSYWFIYLVFFLSLILFLTSIILTPIINSKINHYNKFKNENPNFYGKIVEANKFIPSIIYSQKEFSNSLISIFNNMDINTQRITSKMNAKDIDTSGNKYYSINFLNYLKSNINSIGSYIRSFQSYFRVIPSIVPVRGHFYISSPFGWRIHPIKKHKFFHYGVDLAIMPGSPVHAVADGRVEVSSWFGGYGNAVFINHSYGYSSRYGHLMGFAPNIHEGSFVHRGQTIGYVGMTGVATGYHLHFEVRMNDIAIPPRKFFYLDRFR